MVSLVRFSFEIYNPPTVPQMCHLWAADAIFGTHIPLTHSSELVLVNGTVTIN